MYRDNPVGQLIVVTGKVYLAALEPSFKAFLNITSLCQIKEADILNRRYLIQYGPERYYVDYKDVLFMDEWDVALDAFTNPTANLKYVGRTVYVRSGHERTSGFAKVLFVHRPNHVVVEYVEAKTSMRLNYFKNKIFVCTVQPPPPRKEPAMRVYLKPNTQDKNQGWATLISRKPYNTATDVCVIERKSDGKTEEYRHTDLIFVDDVSAYTSAIYSEAMTKRKVYRISTNEYGTILKKCPYWKNNKKLHFQPSLRNLPDLFTHVVLGDLIILGPKPIPVGPSATASFKVEGTKYDLGIDEIEKTKPEDFSKWANDNKPGTFIVGTGKSQPGETVVYSIAKDPYTHKTRKEAEKEANRLSRLHPSKTFIVYQALSMTYTEPATTQTVDFK
jgi:hypothetical protein